MIFPILRHLHGKLRQRRATLAARAALLDRLASDDDAHTAAAWEQIFAPAGRQEKPFSHRGRCRFCRHEVAPQSRRCDHCDAEWFEYDSDRHAGQALLFCLATAAVALLGGIGAKYMVGAALRDGDFNPEFVEFVESYLWVAGTILVAVMATFVYEMLDVAPKGEWRTANPLDKA